MTRHDTDTRENPQDATPHDRASTLAEAILGISASLDPDTVVQRSWKRPAA